MSGVDFQSHINLNNNEIQNVKFQQLPSEPTGERGLFYFNTTTNKFGYYNGTTWIYGADTSGFVPSTRTVNGKALSSDITLNASDVGALPDTTKYAASVDLSVDTSTYVLTIQLKDQDGNNIGTADTVDLPIESLIMSVTFDDTTNELVITLQNGTATRVPIGAIISGLQPEITQSNKLSADLVDDTTTTNKFVTAAEKTLIASAVQKLTATNTALSVSGGVCTWSITNTLATADVNVQVYRVSDNVQIFTETAATASTVTIKFNSTGNIAANSYRAVITG